MSDTLICAFPRPTLSLSGALATVHDSSSWNNGVLGVVHRKGEDGKASPVSPIDHQQLMVNWAAWWTNRYPKGLQRWYFKI
jgi:hypothetical protein